MKRKYLTVFMSILCLTCAACGKKEEAQLPNVEAPAEIVENSNEVENDFENSNPNTVEIKEFSDRLVINMFASSSSEYKFSGDFVIEKTDIFHFESEEKANGFANSFDESDDVTVKGCDVYVKSSNPADLTLTKKDLLDTYNSLKEEYENEEK